MIPQPDSLSDLIPVTEGKEEEDTIPEDTISRHVSEVAKATKKLCEASEASAQSAQKLKKTISDPQMKAVRLPLVSEPEIKK